MDEQAQRELAERLYDLVTPELHVESVEFADGLREDGEWSSLLVALTHAAEVHGIPVSGLVGT